MQSEFDYISDNIIVGSAELPAVKTANGVCWVVPGIGKVCDKLTAVKYAEEMDRLISKNLRKYSRVLFQR